MKSVIYPVDIFFNLLLNSMAWSSQSADVESFKAWFERIRT